MIQGPCWRQFNGTKPVLVDCPTQLTLISHLLIFPFISCSCSSIRKWNGQSDKITNFDGFSTFFCHFFPIWPHSHTYETNFEKNSALTWFSWPQLRLKVFTPAYRGLPPPTQLTNANIQRWEIRVSWVGQSTSLKGHKSRPEGTPTRSQAQRAPRLLVLKYFSMSWLHLHATVYKL